MTLSKLNTHIFYWTYCTCMRYVQGLKAKIWSWLSFSPDHDYLHFIISFFLDIARMPHAFSLPPTLSLSPLSLALLSLSLLPCSWLMHTACMIATASPTCSSAGLISQEEITNERTERKMNATARAAIEKRALFPVHSRTITLEGVS